MTTTRFTELAWRRVLDVASPFDRARNAVLALGAPVLRPLFSDRGLRVLVIACASLAFAFAMALGAPAGLLAFGPIFLGVPHLLSDARYLVARPRLHRRAAFWIAIALPATLAWVNPHAYVALLGALGAALVARARAMRRIAWAGVILACLCVAYMHERACDVLLAHVHNLAAIAIWALFFSRFDVAWKSAVTARRITSARSLVVIALFVAASLVIFFAPFPISDGSIAGLSVAEQSSYLSPIEDPTWAPRFVVFFAFAQTVHYAVWLRVLPEEDRSRAGMRGFASSARALRADLGAPVLAVFALLAIAILAWSAFDLHAARIGYLRIAITHGALELGVASLFLLEGRARRTESRAGVTA